MRRSSLPHRSHWAKREERAATSKYCPVYVHRCVADGSVSVCSGRDLRRLMRHELPTSTTIHIDPQVPRVLHRVALPPYPHDIAIGPSYDSGVSEDADVVLFNLKKVERELPLRHILEELRLCAPDAIRFDVCAMLIHYLIQHLDIGGDQGINATPLNCRNSVFGGLRPSSLLGVG